MRIILQLFLLVLLSAGHEVKGQAVISPDELKVLYVGAANPVSIAIPGVSSERLTLRTSYGNPVKISPGRYQIHFDNRDRNTVLLAVGEVCDDGRITWLDSTLFLLRNIPRPKFRIGGFDPSGPINISYLFAQSKCYAVIDNFIYNGIRINIVSYHAHFLDIYTGYHHLKVEGSDFVACKKKLAQMHPGSMIIFDSIQATGPSGTMYLEPVVCRLDKIPSFFSYTIVVKGKKYSLPDQWKILHELPDTFQLNVVCDSVSMEQVVVNDAVIKYRSDGGSSGKISWEIDHVGNAKIILGDDSAVGNLMSIYELRTKDKLMDYYDSVFSDTFNMTLDCRYVNNRFNYYNSVFKHVRNEYYPTGEWEFYKNGKLTLKAEMRMVYMEVSPVNFHSFCPEHVHYSDIKPDKRKKGDYIQNLYYLIGCELNGNNPKTR